LSATTAASSAALSATTRQETPSRSATAAWMPAAGSADAAPDALKTTLPLFSTVRTSP